ncbi:MAG: hypothetical protein JJE17_07610 [Peptostreptococcaceae bacterium]|nr:hypothetical protein [Peptostreptococcaceae bacterium]
MTDLTTRLSNLITRRMDNALEMGPYTFSESRVSVQSELRSFGNTNIEKYVNGSMAPVNSRSTEISYEQGERVKNQLKNNLPQSVNNLTYRFQGSVICNTHIEAASDIDLLAITKRFFYYEVPNPSFGNYDGNPFEDVKSIKTESAQVLKKAFPAASVLVHAKSLEVKGGSLLRKIDIVPSAWYNSALYDNRSDETYRGIEIFDTESNIHSVNFPFWNKKLVEDKDNVSCGNYRRAVRFVKTLKADSDNTLFKKISSYDIQGILYHQVSGMNGVSTSALSLVSAIRTFVGFLIQNNNFFTGLMVPDQTRKILDCVSQSMLEAMFKEIKSIEDELLVAIH